MKDFNIKNFDSVLKERRGSSKPGETSFQMPNSYSLIDNSHLKNLGFLNTRRANSHERDLKLETANAINDHKYRKIQELSVENLEHEVKLIREEMRVEFNRQYAALAELSVASEITALQKFEAIGEAARDLLLDNRHGAFERTQQRYQTGYLTEDEFYDELQLIKDRYLRLRDEILSIVTERGNNVRTSYRSHP